MITKIWRNGWPSISICLALAILVGLTVYYRQSETDWISNTILALTAIVLLWYTRETAAMKAELARQNRLQTRPILTLVLGNSLTPCLRNEGKGPALNSLVTALTVQSALGQVASDANETYEISIASYIPQDSTSELKMYRHHKQSGIKGTIPEPEVLYQNGTVVSMTIKYEDIEGGAYVSHLRIHSGRLEWISLGTRNERELRNNRLHRIAGMPGSRQAVTSDMMIRQVLNYIRSLFIERSRTVEDSKEHAIEAFWILNDFVDDLICGTKAMEYFNTPKFKAGATCQVLRIYNKMAVSFLFLTLAKWIEFYNRYHVLIPAELRTICQQLRNELDRRGVREFRNKVVGHIWSKKHCRPLLPSEIKELDKIIIKGDLNGFLKWINDPINNRLGTTIVGTSEAVRDEIRKKWTLSEQELSSGRWDVGSE
jgi:hypothetical protein